MSVSSISSRIFPQSSSSSTSSLRIFSFTPNHFIDCTTKGSITRFVKHSCQPNSVIQVWWVKFRFTVEIKLNLRWESSKPHLCIFSRFPIASNSSITVDLSFSTPLPFECHCSNRHCRRLIPSSISLDLHQSILHPYSSHSHSLFLRRNLKERTKEDKKNNTLYSLYLFIDYKFRRIDGKVKRDYASILQNLRLVSFKG